MKTIYSGKYKLSTSQQPTIYICFNGNQQKIGTIYNTKKEAEKGKNCIGIINEDADLSIQGISYGKILKLKNESIKNTPEEKKLYKDVKKRKIENKNYVEKARYKKIDDKEITEFHFANNFKQKKPNNNDNTEFYDFNNDFEDEEDNYDEKIPHPFNPENLNLTEIERTFNHLLDL